MTSSPQPRPSSACTATTATAPTASMRGSNTSSPRRARNGRRRSSRPISASVSTIPASCPALPTCGLALTEAERIQTPLIDAIEERLERHGLIGEKFSIRITGCPNGCARPYAGDVGLVGRMPGFFALYVGGDFAGTRLSFNLVDKLAENSVADTLDTLFASFAAAREAGDGFGDFCHRLPAR